MKKLTYYVVALDCFRKEAKGNQWTINDVITHVEHKNNYRFLSKEKAVKHLNDFLKSRPESETWKELTPTKNILQHYKCVVDDDNLSGKWYEAYISEMSFSCKFNDGEIKIEKNDN